MSDFKPFDRVLVRDSDDAAWVPRIAVGIDGDGRYLCRKLPCTNGSDLCSWEHARAWDDELVRWCPFLTNPANRRNGHGLETVPCMQRFGIHRVQIGDNLCRHSRNVARLL